MLLAGHPEPTLSRRLQLVKTNFSHTRTFVFLVVAVVRDVEILRSVLRNVKLIYCPLKQVISNRLQFFSAFIYYFFYYVLKKKPENRLNDVDRNIRKNKMQCKYFEHVD